MTLAIAGPSEPSLEEYWPNIAVRPENDDAEFVETSWVDRELRIGDDVVLEITDHSRAAS